MFKSILFDLDGTLTDPKEGICKSVQYALHHMGIEETDLDKLEPFIGPPLLDSFMSFYDMTEEEARQAIVAYRERFSVLGLYENEVYAGIPDLLAHCKEKGILIAVASSKPEIYVNKILEHFKLKQYFDVIVGSELDGRRTKKEEVVEEALSQLKKLKAIPTEEIAMVGDRKFDIEGAKAYCLSAVGVDYGYASKGELKKAGADYIAKNVSELEKFLLKDEKKEGKKEGKREEKRKENRKEKRTKNRAKESETNISTKKNSGNNVSELEQNNIPEKSFFRAIYMLSPFVLYFIILQVVEIFFIAYIQMKTGVVDIREASFGKIPKEYLGTVIGTTGMIVGGFVIWFIYHKSDMASYRWKITNIWPPFIGIFMAVGLNIIFGHIITWIPVSEKSYQAAQFNHSVPYALGLFVYVIISPLVEELIFRWLIYGRIRNVLGVKFAIVLSAIFFGFYHENILQGTYAFLMGILLALVYVWCENLWAPITLHVAANWMIFSLAYMPEKIRQFFSSLWVGILFVFIGAGFLYLMKQKNN